MNNFLLSIVVPVYNEEKSIHPFLDRLLPVLKNYQYEILFIDDGSTDKTAHLIKNISQQNKNIKMISFQRNFGHQMALTCGYQHVKGDCIISLDVDLQDPPEIIPQMVTKWQQGKMVIYAKREKREHDGFLKKQTALLFYWFINFLSDTPIPNNVGDYRLLDKQVVKFINDLPEQSRFLRGLVAWANFPTDYVFFQRDKRFTGVTHYPFSKMLNLAFEGITSFSVKPLRMATYLGFASAIIGFLGIVYAIIRLIFMPAYVVTGWPALFVGIMFLGGAQLITIGIIGEYIGKIYKEVQKRPQFLVKEKVNL